MRTLFLLSTLSVLAASPATAEPSAEAKALADKVISAAGGEGKLLRVFRMKERFNSGPVLADPAKASTRESILEAPKYWWLGGKDRDGEPAKFDVWAWTLVALTDDKTLLEIIPGVEENGKVTLALRLTGTIEPASIFTSIPAPTGSCGWIGATTSTGSATGASTTARPTRPRP